MNPVARVDKKPTGRETYRTEHEHRRRQQRIKKLGVKELSSMYSRSVIGLMHKHGTIERWTYDAIVSIDKKIRHGTRDFAMEQARLLRGSRKCLTRARRCLTGQELRVRTQTCEVPTTWSRGIVFGRMVSDLYPWKSRTDDE